MSRARQHTRVYSETHQKAANPKWNNLEVTDELQRYRNATRVFHRVSFGRIGVAVYLFHPAFDRLFLEHKPEFHLNTLEVYNIRVGLDGVHVGYLFRSPLRIKCDPYYIQFLRRNLDVLHDIILHPTNVVRRYTLQELVFHVHDAGYTITRLENNAVTQMLDT